MYVFWIASYLDQLIHDTRAGFLWIFSVLGQEEAKEVEKAIGSYRPQLPITMVFQGGRYTAFQTAEQCE